MPFKKEEAGHGQFQPLTLNTGVATRSPGWWLRGRKFWLTLVNYSCLSATSDVSNGVLT